MTSTRCKGQKPTGAPVNVYSPYRGRYTVHDGCERVPVHEEYTLVHEYTQERERHVAGGKSSALSAATRNGTAADERADPNSAPATLPDLTSTVTVTAALHANPVETSESASYSHAHSQAPTLPLHLRRDPVVHRQRTTEATRAAMRRRRARGLRMGPTPYGYRATRDGHELENADEQRCLRRMRELRDSGATLAETAATLTLEGFATRRATPWTAKRVSERLIAQIEPSSQRKHASDKPGLARAICQCCLRVHE